MIFIIIIIFAIITIGCITTTLMRDATTQAEAAPADLPCGGGGGGGGGGDDVGGHAGGGDDGDDNGRRGNKPFEHFNARCEADCCYA